METQNQVNQTPPNSTIIIQNITSKSNGIGTAGFVLALLGLIFCWVPIVGWILWLIGIILSFVGIFKSPRGLAIAGLIISFIDLIILIVLLGVLATAIAL